MKVFRENNIAKNIFQLKPDIEVPSESWILLQFTPKSNLTHASVNYTSRFDIVYKIQSRTHHSDHEDTYYCMALFKILRSFAVMYRDIANFFCEDDKHAVHIGDPGTPLATLLRGRPVMTLKGSEPNASDHDWHRFNATPSVLLHNSIPESVEESFYKGWFILFARLIAASIPVFHTRAMKSEFKEHFISGWKSNICETRKLLYNNIKLCFVCIGRVLGVWCQKYFK